MTNTPNTNSQEVRIAKLEKRVAELEARTADIDSLKEEIRTLKKRQFEMFMDGAPQAETNSLEKRVAELEARNANQDAELARLPELMKEVSEKSNRLPVTVKKAITPFQRRGKGL